LAILQFSAVKFPQDSVHQQLSKSIRFLPSYSTYKKGSGIFWDSVFFFVLRQRATFDGK